MLFLPCTHNRAISRNELKENGEDVKVRVRRWVVDVGSLDNADGPKREGDPPDVERKLLSSVMCKVTARLVRLLELCFNVRIVVVIIEDAPIVRSVSELCTMYQGGGVTYIAFSSYTFVERTEMAIG